MSHLANLHVRFVVARLRWAVLSPAGAAGHESVKGLAQHDFSSLSGFRHEQAGLVTPDKEGMSRRR